MAKSWLVIIGILAALIPWLGGGRGATALLVSSFALLLAGLLVWRRPGAQTLASKPLVLALVAWLGWGVTTLIWSVNQYQTQMWVLMALVAVSAGLIAATLTREHRQQLVNGYVLIASAVSLVGVLFFLTGSYDRLTSVFYWPNPAAAYILPALIISTWGWVRRHQPLSLGAALITGAAFWLTDSRGVTLVGIVALLAGLVAASRLRRNWLRLLILLIITCGLALGIAALKPLIGGGPAVAPGSRYADAAQGESTSIDDRLNYLKSAGEIWWDNPLGGTGAGTYGTVHPQYQKRVISASSDAHNVYVQALAEQGIVGAALLAWVIILVLLGMARGVVTHPERGVTALAAGALMLHFGLDVDARYPALLALLAVLIAITYEPPERRPVGRKLAIVLPLMLLAMTGLATLNYQSQAHQNRGEIHDDNHDLQAAAQAYQKAHNGLVYDPDTLTAEGIDYYVLATITDGSKTQLAKSRDLAKRAIQADPKDSQHYFLLARTERLDGNTQEALLNYRKALELDRYNHAQYYVDLAELQLKTGDRAGAQATIDTALAQYTDAVVKNRSADTLMKPSVAKLNALKRAATS